MQRGIDASRPREQPFAKRLMAAAPKTVNRNIPAKRAEFVDDPTSRVLRLYP
jgi:23S rRNA (guanosine2251-2'-O)-methyltransferase